ncbi:MAG: hypothetical protein V4655_14680 [Bdellovibrionota bacterium]
MWIDDQVLEQSQSDICLKTWVPVDPLVVLGRSNKQSTEAHRENCERDGIPILKRLGGGGTVLLHDGCLVVSLGLWVSDYYKNDLYFRLLNQSLIDVFQSQIPEQNFTQRGYSDIVLGDKKLVGTSLFRSRNYLLFQASILVDPKIEWIETYLRHPSAEPDYRKGRSHRDFIMGLSDLCEVSPEEWRACMERDLVRHVKNQMANELRASDAKQVPHLLSRIAEERDLD